MSSRIIGLVFCQHNVAQPRKKTTTKCMVVTTRQKHQRGVPPLNLLPKTQAIEQVSEHRHLGVIVITDDQLKWQAYINCITNTVAKDMYMLSRLRHFSNVETCRTFFHAHIMSWMNCVCNVWDSCSDVHIKKLISVQSKFFARPHKCYLCEDTLQLARYL